MEEKDIVLEMCYTDLNQTYQIWLLEHGSKVIEDSDQFLPNTECGNAVDRMERYWCR